MLGWAMTNIPALVLNFDFMILPKMLSTDTVDGNTMLKHMNLRSWMTKSARKKSLLRIQPNNYITLREPPRIVLPEDTKKSSDQNNQGIERGPWVDSSHVDPASGI